MNAFTPVEDIPKIREDLRTGSVSGKMKHIPYRKEQILKLAYLVQDHAEEFRQAMASDLGRNPLEADFLDIQPTMSQIMEAYGSVEKWAKPEKPAFNFNWFVMSPVIRKEPKGVVLIISPFNFPMLLILGPLAGAFAAGCTALLKPSELSPAVSNLIGELIPKYFDSDVCRVVLGAVPETTKLLELPWDHILYTGSGRIAKILLAAAAKHLTPVTTELGGKNPVVVDPKSDLKLAARRIMWGKLANCGQTCAAPDYVIVPREAEEQFIKELLEVHASFYPTSPKTSDSYSRMATPGHAARLKRMLEETKGEIVIGGETDVDDRYVAPTIVKGVTMEDALMQDELFGPVLPILSVSNVQEAIALINGKDHPLCVYVFSQDAQFKAKVFDNTQSGAVVANDTVIYHAAHGLPFGGIGPSGSGATTGKFNFDIFTHQRASLEGRGWLDKWVLFGRFPPYTAEKAKSLAMVNGTKLPPRPKSLAGSVAKSAASKRWGLWITALAMVVAAASVAARLTKAKSLIAG